MIASGTRSARGDAQIELGVDLYRRYQNNNTAKPHSNGSIASWNAKLPYGSLPEQVMGQLRASSSCQARPS
jgi:hypothetical protein